MGAAKSSSAERRAAGAPVCDRLWIFASLVGWFTRKAGCQPALRFRRFFDGVRRAAAICFQQ